MTIVLDKQGSFSYSIAGVHAELSPPPTSSIAQLRCCLDRRVARHASDSMSASWFL